MWYIKGNWVSNIAAHRCAIQANCYPTASKTNCNTMVFEKFCITTRTIQFVLEPDSLRERVRVRFLFIENSAEGLLGTVNRNEQRQGIIVVMVSCLLFCGIKVALCELCRPLYGSLGGNRCVRAYATKQKILLQPIF